MTDSTNVTSAVHPALLTPAQVADILQVPPRTLERWRSERRGPRFGRFGRHVRYRALDIDAYVESACGPSWDDWQAS